MTKKTFLGAMAVATAVALTGSALVASNMGFKLNYHVAAGDRWCSVDGTSTIALPDNRQTGLNDAKNLMDDIGFASTYQSVQKFIRSSNSFQTYTGRKNALAGVRADRGRGYRVKMQTTVNYIIVGSDDPTLAYNSPADDAVVRPWTGRASYAYNYHQTAADAKALMDDIGFAQRTVGPEVHQVRQLAPDLHRPQELAGGVSAVRRAKPTASRCTRRSTTSRPTTDQGRKRKHDEENCPRSGSRSRDRRTDGAERVRFLCEQHHSIDLQPQYA